MTRYGIRANGGSAARLEYSSSGGAAWISYPVTPQFLEILSMWKMTGDYNPSSEFARDTWCLFEMENGEFVKFTKDLF